jgi:predicted phage replisome organizer
MADVKWIKITTDMFDNRKVKHLRRLPDGDSIVLIWVMLLTLAGRCNSGGMIFLTENIPYTNKMLADELDFEESTVQLAMQALDQLGMIHTNDSGFLAITGWEEHQNIEGMEKIRESKRLAQARWRAKQNALPEISTVDSTVDSTEIENNNADKDIDKEKNKKEKKNKEPKTYSEDAELNQAILSFIEFRKGIKKPMTDRAVDLLIKKLNDMTDYIPEQIEILNQSIMNGWQGVFPLKDTSKPIKQTSYYKQSKADELNDFYNMSREWAES